MDLYEYQGRELFARHGLPVLDGGVATTPEEARAIAERLGGRVVVKAQVKVGGRGKAGGVKLADGVGQLDTTRLTPAADLHLSLDHYSPALLFSDRAGFLRSLRDAAAEHGQTVPGEQFAALVFVQVHYNLFTSGPMPAA